MANWILEDEAAKMLGLKPVTLRKKVKGQIAPKLNVSYTNVNGRNFQYDEKDINKVLNQNAVRQ